jgi:hypothetical protein
MEPYIIELAKTLDTNVNSISGRSYGEQFALKVKLLEHLTNDEKVVLDIDSTKIKAINDSFIKGLFSKIFENKDLNFVRNHIEIKTNNSNFRSLFEKNWDILNSILNE